MHRPRNLDAQGSGTATFLLLVTSSREVQWQKWQERLPALHKLKQKQLQRDRATRSLPEHLTLETDAARSYGSPKQNFSPAHKTSILSGHQHD